MSLTQSTSHCPKYYGLPDGHTVGVEMKQQIVFGLDLEKAAAETHININWNVKLSSF